MAIVTDLSSDTGYGKTSPTKSVLPPITPLYDDNTAYNATFYPDKQVSAPSAAVQPVAYQAPIWESATQTYRDPASGLLWLNDGTPGGQWITDSEYASYRLPAARPLPDVPPLAGEDSYDLYSGPITDADAYWQINNPGQIENLMTQWRWNNSGAEPILGEIGKKEADQRYEAMVREMASTNMIEPYPGYAGTYLGEEYGYPFETRKRWNEEQLDKFPYYTPAAEQLFRESIPAYIGSGISYEPPSAVKSAPDRFAGYYDANQIFSGEYTHGTDLYAHERAHQWDLTNGEFSTDPTFDSAVQRAKADPSVPRWVKDAIAIGEQREANGTGSRLVETYAHIAEMAGGRLHELPQYLLPFYRTLYTR